LGWRSLVGFTKQKLQYSNPKRQEWGWIGEALCKANPAPCRSESSMLRTRTRLVTFRVTDDELEQLKTACERQGSRCLSDFARSTVLSRLVSSESVSNKMLDQERRILALEASMARLDGAAGGSNVEGAVSER
jgi:hypothetical protein